VSYLTKRELDFIYEMAENETQLNEVVTDLLSEYLCSKERLIDDVRYEMALELFEKLIDGKRQKRPSYGELRLVNKPQYQQDLEEIQRQRWLCELQNSSVAKFQEDKRKREAEEKAQIEFDIKQHEQRSARRSIIYEMLTAPTEEARHEQLEAYELLRKLQEE